MVQTFAKRLLITWASVIDAIPERITLMYYKTVLGLARFGFT